MDIKREHAFGIIPFYRKSPGEYMFFIGLTPQDSGGFWKFPKGHKDFEDEEETDAAQRELREETGIDLEKGALITSVSFEEQYFYERGDEVVRKINLFFLGQVDEGNRESIVLDKNEFVEYRWESFSEVLKLLPENSRGMFVDAHDFLVRHRV